LGAKQQRAISGIPSDAGPFRMKWGRQCLLECGGKASCGRADLQMRLLKLWRILRGQRNRKTQTRGQGSTVRLQKISKGLAVQHRHEGGQGITEQALQATHVQQGAPSPSAAAWKQPTNAMSSSVERTASPARISSGARAKRRPPPPYRRGLDEAATAEVVYHLHQVIFRNALRLGDLPDRDEMILPQPEIDQRPQGVVGVKGQPHAKDGGNFPAKRAAAHSGPPPWPAPPLPPAAARHCDVELQREERNRDAGRPISHPIAPETPGAGDEAEPDAS
jgi:hypothetical protein